MQVKTDKVISDSLLSKLNMHIDRTLKEKRESGIDFDFLEKVYGKVLRSKNYVVEGKVKCVVSIKETEILRLALLFFESIDNDFYQKAKDVILGLDERTTMNMVNVNSNQKEGREGYVRTVMGKSRLYVPTQVELPDNKILGKEMCTLEDLYTLVHEISHLFDLNYEDSLPSKDEIEGKETEKKKNTTRQFFSESTAISFEALLTEYLMNNTDYPKAAIKQIYNRRVNDLYDMTSSVYCKLLLAKEKERNGSITQEGLTNFMKKNGLSPSYFKHIAETMLRDSRTLTHRNRYVVASITFPTIVKRYSQDGSETLKEYLEAVKEDRLEDVMDILGGTMDGKRIDEVIANMIQQDRKVNNMFFSAQEIGKSTCRVSSEMKMIAKEKLQQDMPSKDEEIKDKNK